MMDYPGGCNIEAGAYKVCARASLVASSWGLSPHDEGI